ncbi:hypothetical protein WJX79_010625 [Trebouxia sp. C0005]
MAVLDLPQCTYDVGIHERASLPDEEQLQELLDILNELNNVQDRLEVLERQNIWALHELLLVSAVVVLILSLCILA